MKFGTGNGFEEIFAEAFKEVRSKGTTTVYENELDKHGMMYIRKPSGDFYNAKDELLPESEQSRLEFLVDDGILVETDYTEEQVLNNFKYVITDGYNIYKQDGKTEFNEEAVWSNRNFAYNEYFFESKEEARKFINRNNWLESGVYPTKVMVRL